MKYTVDYEQHEDGRWSAKFRMPADLPQNCDDGCPCNLAGDRTRTRLTIEDCVADVYAMVGDDATLEVGDVSEHPEHGL